ncbi:MAG: FeoB-associated Cys-rich membrane protein [Clostridia bacterium]|nr:FeoB-associated Cys-rich membrane protein [Clostridia bacterium]
MENFIIIAILIIIVAVASNYIYKAKKKGQKCIGCPYSKTCGHKNCCDSQNNLNLPD